jgi:hypothetical protein
MALVKKADLGLYRAKAAGKNRITLARGERRRHLRVPAQHAAHVEAPGTGRAAVPVKNVSAGGVLVSLPEPVAVGSKVSVVLRNKRAQVVDLRGEVVRVTPGQGRKAYDVGVRFVGKRTGPVTARVRKASRGARRG